MPPGVSFQTLPQNRGTVKFGDGMTACDGVAPTEPQGKVITAGTVFIG